MPLLTPPRARAARWLLVLIAALLGLAVAGQPALAHPGHADDPEHDYEQWFDRVRWQDPLDKLISEPTEPDWLTYEGDLAAQSSAESCAEANRQVGARFGFVLSDAHLIAESDGSRLCLFWDRHWESYAALLINQPNVAAFRATKAQLQPFLAGAGVDPCHVAVWSSLDRRVQNGLNRHDFQDAGRGCTPEVIPTGDFSASRAPEVARALDHISATAESVFGWSLTWPLRVYLYDSHAAFVEGVRREGGDSRVTPENFRSTFAVAGTIANGMYGLLLDTSRFPAPIDLWMLTAHEYAHLAQEGALGCACYLPFFVVEGGAEYFASLVVGTEQASLRARFQSAVDDERAGRAVPLRELVQRPAASDVRRTAASYSRGYAAMRFLADRWGHEAFVYLHRQNVNGRPEQFLAAMAAYTGLSLDAFDRELSAWLRGQGGSRITTGRPIDDRRYEVTDLFTATDQSVLLIVEWQCLDRQHRGEARIFTPDGQLFRAFEGAAGPGCGVQSVVLLGLSEPGPDRRPAASIPGRWRIEFFLDGRYQVGSGFTIAP